MARAAAIAMVLLLGLASCASYQRFIPRESVNAESPAGHPAAAYPLELDGVYQGTLRTWSRGAWEESDDEGSFTVLHIAIEVENAMDAPLELERETLRIRGLSASRERRIQSLPPERAEGALAIAARSTGTADLWFHFGADMRPTAIEAFELEWTVRAPDGTRYRRVTPFRAWDPPYYNNAYWGWGWGGWGYCW